jgi:hypothetical protein
LVDGTKRRGEIGGGGWLFDVSEAAAGEHNSGSLSSKPGEIQKQGLRTWD